MNDSCKMAYRQGYEDAKAGKPMDLEQYEPRREKPEEVLLFDDDEEDCYDGRNPV